jgi:hypothetical protein
MPYTTSSSPRTPDPSTLPRAALSALLPPSTTGFPLRPPRSLPIDLPALHAAGFDPLFQGLLVYETAAQQFRHLLGGLIAGAASSRETVIIAIVTPSCALCAAFIVKRFWGLVKTDVRTQLGTVSREKINHGRHRKHGLVKGKQLFSPVKLLYTSVFSVSSVVKFLYCLSLADNAWVRINRVLKRIPLYSPCLFPKTVIFMSSMRASNGLFH